MAHDKSMDSRQDHLPCDNLDSVIEYLMQFIDRDELRENLKLSVTERFEKHARRLKEACQCDEPTIVFRS